MSFNRIAGPSQEAVSEKERFQWQRREQTSKRLLRAKDQEVTELEIELDELRFRYDEPLQSRDKAGDHAGQIQFRETL